MVVLAGTALATGPSRTTTVAPLVSSQATVAKVRGSASKPRPPEMSSRKAARRVVSSNARRFIDGRTSRDQRRAIGRSIRSRPD
jgi:hypothetical protein